MFKLLATLFFLICLTPPLMAAAEAPHGAFKVVNTEGFVQEDGRRTPLPVDTAIATVSIVHQENGGLSLTVNGTQIDLFPLENGLAALQWNADGTSLLHAVDIQAFQDKANSKDVPAWGADLAWPGMGMVRLVLLPLGANAYTGFLISHPGSKTVVRQMEFRKAFGPANRPAPGAEAENKGS
ncbi:hypothetical protein [Roseibium sediminicola]|uniref:Copper(I)-binding protein n=1 Tax=Roseibium sediminicola TaxID=2933272 RepID=A0ABT0GRT8_9HYPH|nr:hypothetical protein [Roseibium sp. CAU 1639]MCK7612158.1 hypothetical protein [Roseibium sp. CAU 1639]